MTKQEKIEWARLLIEAVNEPGLISEAYQKFHGYSIGNQALVTFQCRQRGIEVGPVAGYKKWQELGRQVQSGEKALGIWIPSKFTYKDEDKNGDEVDRQGVRFYFKNVLFTIAQTDGDELEYEELPTWNKDLALETLDIPVEHFDQVDGNGQGYATADGTIAINPIADHPMKTLFHEIAHIRLGHIADGVGMSDGLDLEINLMEAEAESVALICAEALGMDGIEYSRGYIQGWFGRGQEIPEASARRIFKVADEILKAGQ